MSVSEIGYEWFLESRTFVRNAQILSAIRHSLLVLRAVTVDRAVRRTGIETVAWTVAVQHPYISHRIQTIKTFPVLFAMVKILHDQPKLRYDLFHNQPLHPLPKRQVPELPYHRFPHHREVNRLNHQVLHVHPVH